MSEAAGGIDTLSYDNAEDSVKFLIGQSAIGPVRLDDRSGDAEDDLVAGFEIIRGSSHGDSLGLRWMGRQSG